MKADSEPGQGSTFTFTMRFDLPTEEDKPAMLPKDNDIEDEKVMAEDPNKKMGWPTQVTVNEKRAHADSKQVDVSMSPDFYAGLARNTKQPATMASKKTTAPGMPIELALSSDDVDKRHHENDEDDSLRELGKKKTKAASGVAVKAKLFSILVVCPLKWTCTAVVGHIKGVLDHHVPHTVGCLVLI